MPDIKQKKGKRVEVDFNGGDITSNAADVFPDHREASKIEHSMLSMLRQRIYGIALGYEDLNDHDTLRNDLALQTNCSQPRKNAGESLNFITSRKYS